VERAITTSKAGHQTNWSGKLEGGKRCQTTGEGRNFPKNGRTTKKKKKCALESQLQAGGKREKSGGNSGEKQVEMVLGS